ncbi:MAG: response regulator, partial [Melioribacteraceae bacterium]
IGFTSILSEDNLSASQAEYVTTIKKNSQSLLLTINDLSELAKIESGKVADVKKQISLKILVDEIASIFKNKFGNRINYTWNVDDNIPNEINVDDSKLRYILNNLLLFMTSLPQQNSVFISVKPAGNKVLISIDGKNNSLPTGTEANIFEPFVISKISELRASNLTGLGLTLVKRYVEILGGEIGAANITGGTSVKFSILVGNRLPGSVSSGGNVESTISQLPKPTADNTKILVIEDDFATSKLLSNYLNKWGYSPTIVNKYDQILSLVEREQYLAIILDIELPNINGLELMRKIKEFHANKSTPIIVCSVEAEQQKAYMMGAVEYFVKPINYNYLVEVLTSYKLRKNSNILCVDDDLPTLNLVKQAIETAGFNSVAENVSANVMNLIKDKDIDLAIIDLDMP